MIFNLFFRRTYVRNVCIWKYLQNCRGQMMILQYTFKQQLGSFRTKSSAFTALSINTMRPPAALEGGTVFRQLKVEGQPLQFPCSKVMCLRYLIPDGVFSGTLICFAVFGSPFAFFTGHIISTKSLNSLASSVSIMTLHSALFCSSELGKFLKSFSFFCTFSK